MAARAYARKSQNHRCDRRRLRTKYHGAGWSSPVARQAHNLKVTGSNPVPATNITAKSSHQAKSLVGSLPSHIPIQKSRQNYSSANLGVESRSWIKAFPLQFGSISHFLCDAAAKFEVKALVPLSAPACPDRDLSIPVFRRLGARTTKKSKPWLVGAIRKPTKSLSPLRACAIGLRSPVAFVPGD